MARLFAGFGALLVVVWLGVWGWARLPAYAPLTVEEGGAVMRALRGGPLPALPRPLDGGGPLLVTAWAEGNAVRRVIGRGPTLGAAVAEAARALAQAPPGPEARLVVDVVRARAPMVTRIAPLFALSVVPGIDGVVASAGGRELWLTADDLMKDDLLAAAAPVAGMDFTLGLETRSILRRARAELGAGAQLHRFRADRFVEPADPAARAREPALPVVRGNVPGPPLERSSLRAAAVAGGEYLLRHLDAQGDFDYEYYTSRDQALRGGYSLPRHAGAAWFLAQLYGATHEPRFLDGARRALERLSREAPPGCDGAAFACVGQRDDERVDLGSAALALVAASEHQLASGDRRYQPWALRLGAFLLSMQAPDGDFRHLYFPRRARRDEHTKLLYYSGEAAFALAKLLALPELPGDPSGPTAPRLADALDRALDYLTSTQYAHLAGQFFFLEDHWTCMAVDAGWDRLPPAHREAYARFCDQFVAFLRRTQFSPADAPTATQPDLLGAYGFSPFLPPHGTPVGSRTETTLSTLHLDERRGRPTAETRAQVLAGVRFLLDHQLRPDNGWLMPDPEQARGGFHMSDVNRFVRIDFIQHACSALLRAERLF